MTDRALPVSPSPDAGELEPIPPLMSDARPQSGTDRGKRDLQRFQPLRSARGGAHRWNAYCWRIGGLAVYWLALLLFGAVGLSVVSNQQAPLSAAALLFGSVTFAHGLFLSWAAFQHRPIWRLLPPMNGLMSAGAVMILAWIFAVKTNILQFWFVGVWYVWFVGVWYGVMFGFLPGIGLLIAWRWLAAEVRLIRAEADCVECPIRLPRVSLAKLDRLAAALPLLPVVGYLFMVMMELTFLYTVVSLDVLAVYLPLLTLIGALFYGLFQSRLFWRLSSGACMVVLGYWFTFQLLWYAGTGWVFESRFPYRWLLLFVAVSFGAYAAQKALRADLALLPAAPVNANAADLAPGKEPHADNAA